MYACKFYSQWIVEKTSWDPFPYQFCLLFAEKLATKIIEVKLGSWYKNCLFSQALARQCRVRPSWQIPFQPPTLTFSLSAASWPTKMYSTYLILKIWSISVWSQKPKTMTLLLTCVILTQKTQNWLFNHKIGHLTRGFQIHSSLLPYPKKSRVWREQYLGNEKGKLTL